MKPRPSRPASSPSSEPRLVQIEKPIYGGAFLARDEGKAVFVPLTLPGEKAHIRIVASKASYATAEAVEIIAQSSERVTPGCRHFGICGGCQYQHASYEAQSLFKQSILRETLERGGVRPPEEVTVLAAEPWAYRNRIRLAFDAAGSPGYRTMRSHAVVPIAECPIAAPLLVRAGLAAAEILRTSPPAQQLSELSLFCNAEQTALLAGIDSAAPAKFPFEKFCTALAERVSELRGAACNIVSPNGQSPRTVARWGAASLDYQAAGAAFRVDHGAFFQVNRWLVDALVDRVTSGHQGTLAWDLFAGVGLFARRLAADFAQVIAVESATSATAALGHNLRGVRATAVKSATLDFLRRTPRGERPDLVVVDPPRTGIGPDATALLAEHAPAAVVYVSCDPATLARDLRALIGSGYAIEKIALADLFPQTFHIETIVHLRRLSRA